MKNEDLKTNDDIVILTKNDGDPIICFGRQGSHEFFIITNPHDYYTNSDGSIYPLEIKKYYTKESISDEKIKFSSYNITGSTDVDFISYSDFTSLLIDYGVSLKDCDKNELSYGLKKYIECLTFDDIDSAFENIFEHNKDLSNNQKILGKMFLDRLKYFSTPHHHIPDVFLHKTIAGLIEHLKPLHLEKQKLLQSEQFDFSKENFWCDYSAYGVIVESFKHENQIKDFYQLFENNFIKNFELKNKLNNMVDNKAVKAVQHNDKNLKNNL